MYDLLLELIVAAIRARPSLGLPSSLGIPQVVLFAVGTIVLPFMWWLISEIGAAVIGHKTLHMLAAETREAEQALVSVVDSLREENARLASVNDALMAQNIKLQKELQRAARASLQKRKPRTVARKRKP